MMNRNIWERCTEVPREQTLPEWQSSHDVNHRRKKNMVTQFSPACSFLEVYYIEQGPFSDETVFVFLEI